MRRITKLIYGCTGTTLVALALANCSSKDEGSKVGDSDTNSGSNSSSSSSSGNNDGPEFSSGSDDWNDAGASTSGGDDPGGDDNEGSNSAPACEELVGLGECGGMTEEGEFKQLNLLIVIDKSSSMVDTPEGFEMSKWEAVKSALSDALGKVQAQVSVGLELYPYSTSRANPIPEECSTGCCQVPQGADAINVPIESGAEAVPKILERLDEASPGGGTPTAEALRRALEYFESGAGSNLDGERFVLLATDGGPNCNADNSCSSASECTPNLDNLCDAFCCPNDSRQGRELCLDDDETEDAIEALKDAGVPTFVVGIPGTEAYSDHLNRFAQAGGATDPDGPEDYFAVTAEGGVEGLTSVFTSITNQLIDSCEVLLHQQPASSELVNVAVNCEVVPQASESGSGWTLNVDSSPASITLEGPVCNWIETQGVERVDVVFGCPTIR